MANAAREATETRVVDKEDYQTTLARLWLLYATLKPLPLQEMIDMARHAEEIGVFLDPTLWREKGNRLRQDIKLMEAFRAIQGLPFGERD